MINTVEVSAFTVMLHKSAAGCGPCQEEEEGVCVLDLSSLSDAEANSPVQLECLWEKLY